jgi:hypothetical protein
MREQIAERSGLEISMDPPPRRDFPSKIATGTISASSALLEQILHPFFAVKCA